MSSVHCNFNIFFQHFQLKASLLETSKVTLNIELIDSTHNGKVR
uniref:Bm1480, isoform c n=1 Tax=Brugia malayi TaxID=6279 RepID=A0A1I9G4M6_BRUMA|nr:Bm1480, isoform c [Brugia malayi]